MFLRRYWTGIGLVCVTFFLIYSCGNPVLSPFEYLSANFAEVDITNHSDFKDLQILSSDLKDNELFLCGETHSVSGNEDIAFKLLKYLHQNAGVRHYMFEFPHSFAWRYNLELSSDTMGEAFAQWPFFKMVYAYNKTLPDSNKISFFGADIERVPEQTLVSFNAYFGRDSIASADLLNLQIRVNNLNDSMEANGMVFTDSMKNELKQLANDLEKSLASHRAEYESLMGDQFLDFDIVLGNLLNHYESGWGESGELDNQEEVQTREQAMFETYRKIYPQLKGKVFGQWGSMHVRQDTTGIERLDTNIQTWSNPETFAYTLQNHPESPVKGKVISIGNNYLNCKTAQHNRQITKEGVPTRSILSKEVEDEMLKVSTTDFSLFKLNGEKSAFDELSHDFQYIFLIQNQGPKS